MNSGEKDDYFFPNQSLNCPGLPLSCVPRLKDQGPTKGSATYTQSYFSPLSLSFLISKRRGVCVG